MHELAIAQGLVAECERIAALHGAARVDRIVARIGVLSGVEAPLLHRAFTVARSGTRAGAALLEIEACPIEIVCRGCGARGPASPSRIVCGACGDWRVDVTSGEEMHLMRVELSGLPDDPHATLEGAAGASHAVPDAKVNTGAAGE